MPVATRLPLTTAAAFLLPAPPRITAVRADRLVVGDHILDGGQAFRVLRIRTAARVEITLGAIAAPEVGTVRKLRGATRVDRVAA